MLIMANGDLAEVGGYMSLPANAARPPLTQQQFSNNCPAKNPNARHHKRRR